MTTPTKPRTIGNKIRDLFIFYLLPILCVGYVNYTQCWPYYAIKDFYKGTAGQHKQWVNDDIVYTASFLLFGAMYYGICYLIKKMF